MAVNLRLECQGKIPELGRHRCDPLCMSYVCDLFVPVYIVIITVYMLCIFMYTIITNILRVYMYIYTHHYTSIDIHKTEHTLTHI